MFAPFRSLALAVGLLCLSCGGAPTRPNPSVAHEPAFAEAMEARFDALRFEPGSVELTEESREALAAHGAELARAPDWRLSLAGLGPSDALSPTLGERRARALHALLIDLGIAAVQVELLPLNAVPLAGAEDRRAATLSDPAHPLIGFRLAPQVAAGP